MFFLSSSLLLGAAALVSLAVAQVDPELTGTWTTKSRKVFTGPVGFDAPSYRMTDPLPGAGVCVVRGDSR